MARAQGSGKCFKQLFTGFAEALARGKNGDEKFHLSGLAYYQFFKDSPAAFLVLNYCNVMKTNKDTSPYFQEVKEVNKICLKNSPRPLKKGRKTEASGPTEGPVTAKHGCCQKVWSKVYTIRQRGEGEGGVPPVKAPAFDKMRMDQTCLLGQLAQKTGKKW